MDWKPVQQRLGVTADGIAGPLTYTALFRAAGCREVKLAADMGRQAAKDFPNYGINTPLRIAHFMAQAGHETLSFLYLKELGGTAYFNRMYGPNGDRPHVAADLGNTQPADGSTYPGRGIFQLTGRANYRRIGDKLGIDLIGHPEKAADPALAVTIACLFWKEKGLSALADRDDVVGITRKINGGKNGLADRMERLAAIRKVLGC